MSSLDELKALNLNKTTLLTGLAGGLSGVVKSTNLASRAIEISTHNRSLRAKDPKATIMTFDVPVDFNPVSTKPSPIQPQVLKEPGKSIASATPEIVKTEEPIVMHADLLDPHKAEIILTLLQKANGEHNYVKEYMEEDVA